MKRCYYCDDVADTIDHALPRVVAGEQTRKVDACRDCNVLAGDTLCATLGEKAAYILSRIRAKYAPLLRTPDWTDDELAELAPTLRESIVRALNARDALRARMRVLALRSASSDTTHGGPARRRRSRA